MKKRRSAVEEPIFYRLNITSFAASYSAGEPDKPRDDGLELYLGVEFRQPVKDVSAGFLVLSTSLDCRGGEIRYDSNRRLHGWLWSGEVGVQALLSLLIAKQPVELFLMGKRFRYRWAGIRHVEWYTQGHPELGS